jgi:hypothetical protein
MDKVHKPSDFECPIALGMSDHLSIWFDLLAGRCGHGSPCEQLCYELHDGMFECDCKDGFVLHQNGYSCLGEYPPDAVLASSHDCT